MLAGWSQVTSRATLGLMVGANTFRNPGLTAKLAVTLDHLSGGRAILGIGGAWFEREHEAFGIDFGSGFGERLDRLDESVGLLRRLLDGERVATTRARAYRMHDALVEPRPVQRRLPIMIGGSGPKKTLRTLARYGDQWNTSARASRRSRRRTTCCASACAEIGRDPATIEKTVTVDLVIRDTRAAALDAYRASSRRPARTTTRRGRPMSASRRRSPTASGRSSTSGSGTSSSTRPPRTTRSRSTASARCSSTSATRDPRRRAGRRRRRRQAGGRAPGAHRRRPDGRRQHRRRLLAPRAARHARPRHRPVQPRRDRAGRVGLGHRGRHPRDDGPAGRLRRGDVVRPRRPRPRAPHRPHRAAPGRRAADRGLPRRCSGRSGSRPGSCR